ncbi:hypothetical protein GVAV_000658 [Gurleya vavrai]
MGPSGCGKTTLMSALAGRIQSGSITNGNVTYNDEQRDARKWLRSIGYVDQDDAIYENLSVYDTLKYSANLRLDNVSNKDIDQRIEQILQEFGLNHVCKNRMSKLSGGERKRTMIAVELLSDPELIFLDEPTSGLDTKTALRIIKILKELASKGKTVVITIHQPSVEIFSLFDKLLLMTQGKTIYFGPANKFEEVLSSKEIIKREGISFPDFIAEMAVQDQGYNEENMNLKKIHKMIEEHNEMTKPKNQGKEIKKNENYYNYSINFKHCFTICKRKLKSEFKNKWQFFKPILGSIILIGIAISILYGRNATIDEFNKPNVKRFGKISDDELKKLRKFLIKNFFNTILGKLMLAIGSSVGITAFFDNQNVIKREIAAGAYTVSTHFFSLFCYYTILQYVTMLIMLAAVAIIYPYSFSYLTPIIYIISPIIGVIISLAFGSISSNRRITMICGYVLSISVIVHVSFVQWLDQICASYLPSALIYLRYIFFLTIFFPFLHFESIIDTLGHNTYEKFFEGFKTLSELFIDIMLYGFFQVASSFYILDFMTEIYHSVILFISTLILLYIFGCYRQTTFLRPHIRMQLQK